ncbi:MAG: ATP-grasp domain-containing protein, partial [Nanoarchaeota archaeon]|nr:ATP-grasp domain-containing protein [Nanoarchaeota archaeon]
MKNIKLEKALKETFNSAYFFTKYPELKNNKDTGNPVFPFVENGYDSQTIVSETMRFFPVAALTGGSFFMPSQAPIEQVESWLDLGLPIPDVQIYDNDDPQDYTKKVNALASKSLHLLHPFSNFSSEVCAVNPQLLLELNTKSSLPNLTEHTPKKKKATLQEMLAMQPPFVVKKTTGSSGDGVKIIKRPSQLSELESFLNGSEFFVEDYIDYVHNHSLQFFVDSKGEIHYIGYGEQNTTEEGEYLGLVCMLNKTPAKGLLNVGEKTCAEIAARGYKGFVGLDILEDDEGKYHIIDPNIRCTAATPVYLLQEILVPILSAYIYVGSGKMQAE